MRRHLVSGLLALTAFAAICTPAHAELRSGAQTDPQDQQPSLSGPSKPDVQQVTVSYDTSSGAVAVTLRLFGLVADGQGRYLSLTISEQAGDPSFPQYCGFGGRSLTVNADLTAPSAGTLSASGFDGSLTMTPAVSADGHQITWSVTDARLAGRDLRCFDGATRIPDRYGHCGDTYCTYIAYSYVDDTLDSAGYFTGYAPPPPAPKPACDNGLDDDHDGQADWPFDSDCINSQDTSEQQGPCADGVDNDHDGRVDLKDPGCRGKSQGLSETDPAPVRARFTLRARAHKCGIDTSVEVLPDLNPAKLFPFAKVRISVRGHGRTVTRTLKAGRYTITGVYLGDRWRTRSVTRTRHARVPARCR